MNSVREFETHSDEETQAVGCEIAALLPAQAVVLLIGDLGSGKTTLTKGIVVGRGAAPASDVSSPTFALIHEYGEPVTVYHADLYRLETLNEVRRLGLEELFDRPGALLIVEWGERFLELFPPDHIEIRLSHVSENSRCISFIPWSTDR
jgi:tRNA threonylcarbamoyladenosine biosynthesis protein TsaE